MDRRAIAVRAGLVAPAIAVLGITLATMLDPGFSWVEGALSHAGERDATAGLAAQPAQFYVFNGSLIAAGALGLAFAWLLHVEIRHPLQQWGTGSLFAALLALVGVGVFHLPHGLHAPAAIVHFLGTMGFLLLYGAGTVAAGRRTLGFATAGLGLAVLGVWLCWSLFLEGWNVAVPEAVSTLSLAGWTFVVALRRYQAETPARTRSTVHQS